MKKEANEIIKRQRVKRIIDLMGQGFYVFEIVGVLKDEWKCTERNIYKYINASKKLLGKEISERDVTDLLNKFNDLYREARNKGDIKTANAILANLGKFTVGEKSSVEHSGSISGININVIGGTQS